MIKTRVQKILDAITGFRRVSKRDDSRPTENGDAYRSNYYSENGEDACLLKLFHNKSTGFYVDVGAHHPFRFSITARLSELGWCGINIDPRRDIAEIFKRVRPRDKFLQIGISGSRQTMEYFEYNEPTLNGFNGEFLRDRHERHGFYIIDSYPVETLPLDLVLEQHLQPGCSIDLLSIDVEGFEKQVLQSNNWCRYLPAVIAIEQLECRRISELEKTEVFRFLQEFGYSAVSKLNQTVIYQREDLIGIGLPE